MSLLERRIDTILRSVAERRFVHLTYRTPDDDEESGYRVSDRDVVISHVFETQEGYLVAKSYCMLRKAKRAFRLDRMEHCRIAGPAPDPTPAPDGKVRLYPGKYPLRLTYPTLFNEETATRAIQHGWKPEPWAAVLRPERDGHDD